MARQKNKLCAGCQTVFKGKDSAIACSARCRKRLERARKALASEAQKVEVKVVDLKHSAERTLSEFESQLAPATSQAGFIGEEPASATATATAPPSPTTPLTPPLQANPASAQPIVSSSLPISQLATTGSGSPESFGESLEYPEPNLPSSATQPTVPTPPLSTAPTQASTNASIGLGPVAASVLPKLFASRLLKSQVVSPSPGLPAWL